MRSVTDLSPRFLRELAAAIEARQPDAVAIRMLSRERLDQLADMLISGKKPTIGWWRRSLGLDANLTPKERMAQAGVQLPPVSPATGARVTVAMVTEDGYPIRAAVEAVLCVAAKKNTDLLPIAEAMKCALREISQ